MDIVSSIVFISCPSLRTCSENLDLHFIMLKNEMKSYVRIGREGFEKSYLALHAGRGVKHFQNHPYVINEWPLILVRLSPPPSLL